MKQTSLKVLLLAGLLTIAGPVLAWDTPQQALNEYLKFELAGGRTSSEGFAKLDRYVYLPADYDEPGWDMVTLVDSYRVDKVQCANTNHCTAKVVFKLTPTAAFKGKPVSSHPRGGEESMTYKLEKGKVGWKLLPGFGEPLITPQILKTKLH